MTDSPFGISDRVERLVGLLDRADVLDHRVGEFSASRPIAPSRAPTRSNVGAPVGVEVLRSPCSAIQLAKPSLSQRSSHQRHGDEVAEPLVRHLVRLGAEDVVALAPRW